MLCGGYYCGSFCAIVVLVVVVLVIVVIVVLLFCCSVVVDVVVVYLKVLSRTYIISSAVSAKGSTTGAGVGKRGYRRVRIEGRHK